MLALKRNHTSFRSAGFTVIELMIAISVMAVISTMMVISFRAGKARDELKTGGQLLASFMQQSQTYALAGRTFDDSGVVPFAWGVSFDVANNNVFVFGDNGDYLFNDDSELWQQQFYSQGCGCTEDHIVLADYNVEFDEAASCMDNGSGAGCESGSSRPQMDISFALPVGSRHIDGNFTPNVGQIRLVLIHDKLPGKSLTVSVNGVSGRVNLGVIQ